MTVRRPTKILHVGLLALALSSSLLAQLPGDSLPEAGKTLLVYDKIDDATRFYIETIRQQLTETGIPFEETAVDTTATVDANPYNVLVVYSRVMAFAMMAPVKKWLRAVGDLRGKRILLLVTANRWFAAKQRRDFGRLIAKRNGTLVDAVSMATASKSPEEKVRWIRAPLEKLK